MQKNVLISTLVVVWFIVDQGHHLENEASILTATTDRSSSIFLLFVVSFTFVPLRFSFAG